MGSFQSKSRDLDIMQSLSALSLTALWCLSPAMMDGHLKRPRRELSLANSLPPATREHIWIKWRLERTLGWRAIGRTPHAYSLYPVDTRSNPQPRAGGRRVQLPGGAAFDSRSRRSRDDEKCSTRREKVRAAPHARELPAHAARASLRGWKKSKSAEGSGTRSDAHCLLRYALASQRKVI